MVSFAVEVAGLLVGMLIAPNPVGIETEVVVVTGLATLIPVNPVVLLASDVALATAGAEIPVRGLVAVAVWSDGFEISVSVAGFAPAPAKLNPDIPDDGAIKQKNNNYKNILKN